METGERLSAYLAGELDADDAAALEAELAGDRALRAQLDRIRRSNQALEALGSVAPPVDFSARLREAVAHEVAARDHAPAVDELAARRLQRRAGAGRYLGAGVAAAAVLVVGAIGLSQILGGGDDADPSISSALEAAPADGAEDPLAAYVRITDVDHDADSVEALAKTEGVVEVPARVDEEAARDLEESRYSAFGLGPWSAGGLQDAPSIATAPQGDAAEGGSAGGATSTGGSTGGGDGMGTSPDDDAAIDAQQRARLDDPFADVRRCLPEIVTTANQPVIPLYAEVATFEGEPAIIYLVLTREPDATLFNRVEAWVVSRGDCFPLLFRQIAR